MGLVDSLLVNAIIGLDDVFLATIKERSSSCPQFAVIVTLEESTLDLVVLGIAIIELFGVSCDPVRLGLNYPAQPALLSFPNIIPGTEVVNPDAVILLLREECPLYRQNQLARILHCRQLRVVTVIEVLYAWLYPDPNPDNEED